MCHQQCIEELALMTRYASLELQLQVSAVALLFGVLLEKFLREFKEGNYSQAKLANVLFTFELQRRWQVSV
jgi:NAD(P)-dependent dehydrogenase (short-subunit alcohol dehydrogenase family)